MAQVAGVPKREPCQKCGNPVFLAERLIVGKSLYHRTCLRCARCDSQLTLGSFYETEIDGEFCCETCPDEEKKIQISQRLSGGDQVDNVSLTTDSRQSFNEKLAMFQTDGKGFLQKSLSDEEKSKSLKRLTEMYTKSAPESMDEPPKIQPVESTEGSDNDSDSEGSSPSDSDEEPDEEEVDEIEVPPPMPTTKPPSLSSDESETEAQPALPSTKPPPIASKLNVLQKIQAGNNNKFNRFVASASTANTNGTVITAKPSSHTTSAIESHQESADATPSQSSQSHTNSSINDTIFNSVENLDDKISFNRCNGSVTSPTNDVNAFARQSPIDKGINENINLNNNRRNDNNDNNDSMPSDALNSFTNVTKDDKNYDDATSEQHTTTEENGMGAAEVEQTSGEDVVVLRKRLHTSNISDSNECSGNVIRSDNVQDASIDNLDSNSANVDKRQVNNSNNSNNRNNSVRNSNVVRSRLSQFEAMLQTEPPRNDSDSINLRSNKSLSHSRMNVGISKPNEITHQFEKESEISNESHASIANTTSNSELLNNINTDNDNQVPANDQSLNNDNQDNDKTKSVDQSEIERNISYHHTDEMESDEKQTSTTIDMPVKPVPIKRVTIDHSHIEEDASTPPTPLKRRSKAAASVSVDQVSSVQSKANEEVSSKKAAETVAEEPVQQDTIQIEEKVKYPGNLNPFGDDDDDEEEETITIRGKSKQLSDASKKKDTSNPFDSSDDEIELLKATSSSRKSRQSKLAKQRVSTNPFGSESEDEDEADIASTLRTPVPTPRKVINGSMHTTPEPSPRMSRTLQPKTNLTARNMKELYGSSASLISSNYGLMKNNYIHGSMNSLASSSTSTPRHRKGRAPPPPPSISLSPASAHNDSMRNSRNSSPSNSIRATPIGKKKRVAPIPPTPKTNANETITSHYVTANTRLDDSLPSYDSTLDSLATTATATDSSLNADTSIDSCAASVQSETVKDSGDETEVRRNSCETIGEMSESSLTDSKRQQKKLIPLDASLLNDVKQNSLSEGSLKADENVTYRRTIKPLNISDDLDKSSNGCDRQWEKMKENKESQNKNRQSQIFMTPPSIGDSDSVYGSNKSSYGKWKRRKGPAPSLPVPPRKVIQMLPLQDIRHELEVIEVQQQGLEKQGVMLEKMIRERCEGAENENTPVNEFKPNTKEVEDLILQLFELVNEKNELFRRQAELMYLRRQHRLEQEQADIEYEIRVLMAQPECNKTDSDKAREEALISRLVDIVQLRNKVIESLEMDRLREAEEDQSIKQSLEQHTAKRDEEMSHQTPTKLSKKEKKKQKESKKLAKQKKMDADKDADESELCHEKLKEKKKKKKFLF